MGAPTAGPDFVGKIDRPNPSGYILSYYFVHPKKGVGFDICFFFCIFDLGTKQK